MEEYHNIKLTIAYEGSSFFGWEACREGPTIEGELKKALQNILHEPLLLQAASRTDRGVHASFQVVNFFTKKTIDPKKLLFGLNRFLPSSIRLLDVTEMPLSFHPTLDSIGKSYRYEITKGPIQLPFDCPIAWHLFRTPSTPKMQEALIHLLGKKDFSAFCNKSSKPAYDPICDIQELRVEEREHRLTIFIKGDHFLHKMVRNIVGTLVYIGLGKISLDKLPSIIASKSRPCAGVTAPALGLTLTQVYYPKEY